MLGRLALLFVLASCGGKKGPSGPRVLPTPSVQVGACAEPMRDGVISENPKLERSDRDLDDDKRNELITVDRSLCTAEGNCFWNVFLSRESDACARYAGTFKARVLEMLATKGEGNMRDVRGHWYLHGGRRSLETYRFVRGGYLLVDAVQCRQAGDDRLECMESQ